MPIPKRMTNATRGPRPPPAPAAAGRSTRVQRHPRCSATVLVGSRQISIAVRAAVRAPSGRRSSGPWPRSGCPAARTPRRAWGRRCGPPPGCTPKVSRATRAEMMLELSPLETAAKASAGSMPRVDEDVAVEADAGHREAGEVGAQPAERVRVLVDDGHRVPARPPGCGRGRADPAAAHDHDVHSALPLSDPRPRMPVSSTPQSRIGPRTAGHRPVRRVSTIGAEAVPSPPCQRCPTSHLPKRLVLGRAVRSAGWATPCPSGSRCRSSPPTAAPRWPTPPDEILT